MTVNEDSAAFVDRLDALITQLRQLGVPVGDVGVTPAAVNANGTPGAVAPGELIESTWGNAVVDSVPQISYSLGAKAARKMLVQGGYTIITTDGNGDGRIDFASPFTSGPTGVQVQNSNPGLLIAISINTIATTYVTYRVRNITDGAATINFAVKVSWLAIGER